MSVTKMIAMIFLSVYLILMGLATMAEITLTPAINNFVQLLAVAAGVLILISVGRVIKKK